jgi:hypothetical protein
MAFYLVTKATYCEQQVGLYLFYIGRATARGFCALYSFLTQMRLQA